MDKIDKEEQGTWTMGERERLRRAKKKNQRIIAAIIGLLAVAIVVLTICLTHKLYSDSKHGELYPENTISSEMMNQETQFPEDSELPEDTDTPDDEDEDQEDPLDTEETETPSVTPEEPDVTTTTSNTSSGTVTINPSVSGQTSTTTTGGTTTTNKNNSTTTSSGTTSNRKTTTTTTTLPSRIKSATLYCSVTSATEGGTATLSYKAVDSNGKDITSQCVVSFTQTDNCTVSNKTVTFGKAGTAKITAKVTYKMTAVKTQTISIPITAATADLASVALNCSVTTAERGQFGTLTLTALDANGADISNQCTVTYTTAQCTASGNSIGFTTTGTAAVYATVTYNGVTLQTNTVNVTVTEPVPEISRVDLSCTASTTPYIGDTAQIWFEAWDASGNNITDRCQFEYKLTGCTVSGGTISFPELGNAEAYVVATYNGKTLESNHFQAAVKDKVVLTSAQVVLDVDSTVELGTEKTLSFTAKDQLGREITGCTVTYSGTNCTVSQKGTVIFDQPGTAEIAATVEYNGVTVVSDPPITVKVQVGYTLDNGTKIDLADVSQKCSDTTFGYELYLPGYFTAEEKKDENDEVIENIKSYTYKNLEMTITAAGSSRETGTDDLKTLYEARVAELKEQEAEISEQKLETKKNRYSITWEKDGIITQEIITLDSKAENSLTISYPTANKTACGKIASYTIATYQTGNLE